MRSLFGVSRRTITDNQTLTAGSQFTVTSTMAGGLGNFNNKTKLRIIIDSL
jgi:hypothetical protein